MAAQTGSVVAQGYPQSPGTSAATFARRTQDAVDSERERSALFDSLQQLRATQNKALADHNKAQKDADEDAFQAQQQALRDQEAFDRAMQAKRRREGNKAINKAYGSFVTHKQLVREQTLDEVRSRLLDFAEGMHCPLRARAQTSKGFFPRAQTPVFSALMRFDDHGRVHRGARPKSLATSGSREVRSRPSSAIPSAATRSLLACRSRCRTAAARG
jgi:hypothetical protein